MKNGQSMANWNPGAGKAKSDARVNELMKTEAKDGPETVSATNELKQATGKSGKPKGSFGIQGREF